MHRTARSQLSAHTLFAALLGPAPFALCLLLALPATAISLPSSGAFVSGQASTAPDRVPPGEDTGLSSSADPITASVVATAGTPGLAQASASSTTAGALRSVSLVEAAYGGGGPAEASSQARWVSTLTTVGSDPGAAIDLDFQIAIDGVLDIRHNNANPDSNDIFAAVGFDVTLYDASGTVLPAVFSGTATLRMELAEDTGMVLDRTGDWADAARDGDFLLDQEACGFFACTYEVETIISLDDAGFVSFAEVFAIEVTLDTSAFAFNGFEIQAQSNFDNTANVGLSTSTPGVEFVAVPEPTTTALLALGFAMLGGMGVRGRRTD